MIESISVSIFPILFLLTLTIGEKLLYRNENDIEDVPPINKRLFLLSKYSILLIWAAMLLQSWDIHLFIIEEPQLLKWISICLWVSGFTLLFLGRFGLGTSFKVGTPKEKTNLKVNGIYRLSRNPMYLGLYATFLATTLYTLNPVLLLIGFFVTFTHHKIILAEEQHLQKTFGEEYTNYCNNVSRYL